MPAILGGGGKLMDAEKLNQVIERRNEESERDALHQAEHLIENIVNEQQSIARSNERIAEYRKQLRELEVETVDPTAVLGGD
jgi:hypothetical protein